MKAGIRLSTPARYGINTLLLAGLLGLLLALSFAGVITSYYSKVLMLAGINIILTVSLNMVTGYLGQLPLGHAGFMAVGAYTGGIFLKAVEDISASSGGIYYVMILAALMLSGLAAMVCGVLIGIPVLRLRGDYLAIITLGFGEIIRIIITNIDSVLGFKLTYGADGLKRIPKFSTLTIVFLAVAVTCFLIHTVMKSRHGRAILAIRDNEIAAESCGVNVTFYKVFAFAMSAFFAGVAGCLYSGYIGSLQPSVFDFMRSIEILVMVVLGGMGSMLGSVVSATVLTILPEALRGFDDYRTVIYSLTLVLMMIFRPKGLMGSYDFSMGRALEKLLGGIRALLAKAGGRSERGGKKA